LTLLMSGRLVCDSYLASPIRSAIGTEPTKREVIAIYVKTGSGISGPDKIVHGGEVYHQGQLKGDFMKSGCRFAVIIVFVSTLSLAQVSAPCRFQTLQSPNGFMIGVEGINDEGAVAGNYFLKNGAE